jgi:hypothetical protein
MNAYERATCDFFLVDYPADASFEDIKELVFNKDKSVELFIPFAQLGEDYDIPALMDDMLERLEANFIAKN